MQKIRKYQFAWKQGNNFSLLVDARKYFPRMLDAIAKANHFILLEIYLFESGDVANRFINALIDARQRGVVVKLIFDGFGTYGMSHYDRSRLIADTDLVFYNPLRFAKYIRNMFRDHRKILVVDGQVAYVGGTGITDDFDPPAHPEKSWHDLMVEITGPVVNDWCQLFSVVWARTSPNPLSLEFPVAKTTRQNMTGRITGANGLLKQEVKRSFMMQIERSRERVWMATAYFIPSWKVRRKLRKAAHRGLDVRLLLPGPLTDHPAVRRAGQRFYTRLLHRGVRIFEYQPRVLHAKVLLCDNWSSIGSTNMDRWSLRWNLEANQEVDDPVFAEQVKIMLEADFQQSKEQSYQAWLQRPWRVRVAEWFWGSVDLWLSRLGHDKRGPNP